MDKTALITGTSSGIGLVTAIALAEAGFHVVATMRDPTRGQNLLAAAAEAGVTERIEVRGLDVTKHHELPDVVAAVVRDRGTIDVLVNNAGYALAGFAEDIAPAELRAQFETNFFGHVAVTRAVLPQMRKQKSGHIINISSISGLVSYPMTSSYSASKHALEAWSEALRIEVRSLGIRVVLVEPGAFESDIWEKNVHVGQQALSERSVYRERSRRYADMVKARKSRRGDPRAVARLIAKIAKDPNPTLRYRIGGDAHTFYWLKRLLPWKLYEGMIAKGTKID